MSEVSGRYSADLSRRSSSAGGIDILTNERGVLPVISNKMCWVGNAPGWMRTQSTRPR